MRNLGILLAVDGLVLMWLRSMPHVPGPLLPFHIATEFFFFTPILELAILTGIALVYVSLTRGPRTNA